MSKPNHSLDLFWLFPSHLSLQIKGNLLNVNVEYLIGLRSHFYMCVRVSTAWFADSNRSHTYDLIRRTMKAAAFHSVLMYSALISCTHSPRVCQNEYHFAQHGRRIFVSLKEHRKQSRHRERDKNNNTFFVCPPCTCPRWFILIFMLIAFSFGISSVVKCLISFFFFHLVASGTVWMWMHCITWAPRRTRYDGIQTIFILISFGNNYITEVIMWHWIRNERDVTQLHTN